MVRLYGTAARKILMQQNYMVYESRDGIIPRIVAACRNLEPQTADIDFSVSRALAGRKMPRLLECPILKILRKGYDIESTVE